MPACLPASPTGTKMLTGVLYDAVTTVESPSSTMGGKQQTTTNTHQQQTLVAASDVQPYSLWKPPPITDLEVHAENSIL